MRKPTFKQTLVFKFYMDKCAGMWWGWSKELKNKLFQQKDKYVKGGFFVLKKNDVRLNLYFFRRFFFMMVCDLLHLRGVRLSFMFLLLR